jgi:hypothetical protein
MTKCIHSMFGGTEATTSGMNSWVAVLVGLLGQVLMPADRCT